MSAAFRPIAVVGYGCIVPGCDSAEALWRTVEDGGCRITAAPAGDWRVTMARVMGAGPDGAYRPDHAWSDRGGYVGDLAVRLDPAADLDPALAAQLDPVFGWTLHAAGQALQGVHRTSTDRGGLVLGNLSYPTRLHGRLVETQWVEHALGRAVGPKVHPLNRFMSGAPAMLAARAFGLHAGSLALDAACASGLYAIKVACDRLQDGAADLMLAGGVNAADQLFLHVGFSALNALSRTGLSRPFHRDADGLIPAEGAGFVALKRLDDALDAGDRILGVIRGVGLSNDGRSGGFLSPSRDGQMQAMRAALTQSGLDAGEVSYVECHATGTQVGDATEIASLAGVYGQAPLVLGSLKANLGHLITASGVVGLIKTLKAMEQGVLPATPGARPLSESFAGTAFTVPDAAAPWEPRNGQRTAAVSAFGFGGNNAHLLVQQHADAPRRSRRRASAPPAHEPVAIVGLAVRTHLDADAIALARRLLGGQGADPGFDAGVVELGARQLAFPPAELKKALGQQLVLLEVARQALEQAAPADPARAGVFVGMQTDSRVCRHAARIRWSDLMAEAGVDADPAWTDAVADLAAEALDSATVIGKMPNITANRLSNQLDFKGPGFAVSREELSGDAALELAISALRRSEIETALVGAVDLAREPLQAQAGGELLGAAGARPADAAVMLVLKSATQAAADGDTVLALIRSGAEADGIELPTPAASSALFEGLGHAHAAAGLLHLAFGVQMLGARAAPDAAGAIQPLLGEAAPIRLMVCNGSFQGERAGWTLEASAEPALRIQPPLRMLRYAAADRERLAAAVRADAQGGEGPCRLAIVGRADQLPGLRDKALRGLAAQPTSEAWTLDGISFRARPLKGELAFAFTGAASAYAGMGRGLLLAMPDLADKLSTRLPGATGAADWIYRTDDPRGAEPFHQLAGSSFLCQLHATLSLQVLGLKPQASLGLSSGETNGMFAFGLWRDFQGLLTDVTASGLYSHALAADFDAVRTHWGLPDSAPVQWDNFRVRAPMAAVQAAVAATPRCYLTIVNSPEDCVIGGDADACRQVLASLGAPPATPLGHDLAVHCEAVTPFEAAWRAAHSRETWPAPTGVRFYSNALGGVFQPDRDSVAEALTGQALRTVDFPMIVEQAWADGVRIFVEHGPRGSLTTAISEILGEREHLAVPLDRFGAPGDVQAWRAAAQLWCAGVAVDVEALETACAPSAAPSAPQPPTLRFRLTPEHGDLPELPPLAAAAPPVADPQGRLLPKPPPLPRLAARPDAVEVAAPVPALVMPTAAPVVADARSAQLVQAHQRMTEAHALYLRAQAEAMQAYTETLTRLQSAFLTGVQPGAIAPPPVAVPPAPAAQITPSAPPPRVLPGPKFDRAQLEVLAGGRISQVFGASFAGQDDYAVQVRMPEPPLLLCDRVLGIEGEAHSMGRGTIWTATDVTADSWYLHHGRMPPGVFIECGQADLLLISWLGVDAFNKGERAYRLLGCELVFNGDLPQPGETLEYEIRIDGHARQGDVRLFFFNYDCRVGGELRISVRNGQAGFFTREELENSSGVIWSPEAANYTPQGAVAPPPQPTAKTRFSQVEVQAYLDGDLTACFGPAFALADTHTRTPATPADRRNFLGEVTELDFAGGPAGRGYMRVEKEVRGDEWFFDGHFKNDPCMPGTLMADACLQAMAFYMVATGRTLQRDGWRFQPVRGEPYTFLCRGQVTPSSRRIVYEIFVDEVVDGDLPVLRAHVLCTVDGRKAFLCERLALQLVPDWPLSSMPEALAASDCPDPRPLARIGDFALDYRSLINCAWGRPTAAFGPGFAHYEGPGRSPRLPGPPYHFMTRITALDGEMGQMKAGGRVTALYDMPADGWYFAENGAATMPNAVLMEVALQPCGWLASYTLKRAAGEPELLFRNLDGDAVQHREVRPGDRTVCTEVEMLSLDRVGDLIIEKFRVRCTVDGAPLLDCETVFGFFPPEAMADQKGFRAEAEDRARLEAPSPTVIDLAERPPALFAGSARLPDSKLLMIDRISGLWRDGGAKCLGRIRAEKDVVSTDWFFKAHFFQDPVQPGSLGIEAMLQAIQAFMLLDGMAEGLAHPRFEPLALGERAVWHYRGQVTPERERVVVDVEVEERGRDARGPFVICRATLWVDGLQIYQAPRLGMRLVESAPPPDDERRIRWTLDLEGEAAWAKDHRPTHTIPTLPLTYELEMMASAAAPLFPGQQLVEIETAEALRWVAFHSAAIDGTTEVEVLGADRARVTLHTGEPDPTKVAVAELRFGPRAAAGAIEPLEPLAGVRPVADPYVAGSLFHGPALQLMRGLQLGANGAAAVVDADANGLPKGALHPGLLDAALHCIPHDEPRLWRPELGTGFAAYPIRVEAMRIFGDLAASGETRVEARFRGLVGDRLMRSHLRLSRDGRLLAMFDLVEVLMPTGRLGLAAPADRRAFLGERRFAPGVALSDTDGELTRLARQACRDSDWLPGTLAAAYDLAPDADVARSIAIGDHVGQELRLHPSAVRVDTDGVCRNLPLNPWRLSVSEADDEVQVRAAAPGPLDWSRLQADWSARMNGRHAFVQDLGIAALQRFVRRLVLEDPDGFEGLKGRPVLYLGNHQTGVESLLFLIMVASLAELPAGAIAKKEHADSWVGQIQRLADEAMGAANPLKLWLFDRSQPADLLRLLQAYGDELSKRPSSLLVHTDGTRGRAAGAPVGAVSSVLIDLALANGLPIVPVRFAGGLPLAEADERLEFPLGGGRQDYFIGRALDPAELRSLGLAERSRLVRDRINALGPQGEADQPLPGEPAFTTPVEAARAAGQGVLAAHLRAALEQFPGLGEESRRLLREPSAAGSGLSARLAPGLIGAGLLGAAE